MSAPVRKPQYPRGRRCLSLVILAVFTFGFSRAAFARNNGGNEEQGSASRLIQGFPSVKFGDPRAFPLPAHASVPLIHPPLLSDRIPSIAEPLTGQLDWYFTSLP